MDDEAIPGAGGPAATLDEPAALALDLFDAFADLRETNPVMELPDLGLWMVTRYADCIEVIRDSERFTSSRVGDTMAAVPEHLAAALPTGYPVSCPALVNNDAPAHTRVRKLAQRSFTPSATARHEATARAIASRLIDEFVDAGEAELVEDFARPLPCTMLATILGIPADDQDRFIAWGLGVTELMSPFLEPDRRDELAVGQVEFAEYVSALIRARSRAPQEDMISELVHMRVDGEPALSEREVLAIVAQLLTAGFETTMAGIANTVMLLCQHPAALDRVRSDPTALDGVVEESLRRLPPARGVLRETTCEVELGGRTLPAGSRVYAVLSSANHDPTRFSCPDRFHIDRERTELRRHLAFGQGTHFCIGAPLAKMEIRVGVGLLLERLPGLELVADQELAWAPSFVFNGPESLRVRWATDHTTGGEPR